MNRKRLTGLMVIVGMGAGLGLIFLAGCASRSDPAKAAAQTPYGRLLQDAGAYVVRLKDYGKLPGFQPGDRGSLTTIPEPVWEKAVTFPVSVVVQATKQGDDSLYRYTIMKTNPQAPWQLVDATQFDAAQHPTKLFP